MKSGATIANPHIVARASAGRKRASKLPPRAASELKSRGRVRKAWYGLIGLWLVLLSGGLAPWLGTPGVIQQVRLQNLLSARDAEQARLQSEIDRLREDSLALERSRTVQHREIRKVLGYAAENEIVFEFGSGQSL